MCHLASHAHVQWVYYYLCPIAIALTSSSSTTQVKINGTEQFTGSPSNGVITIPTTQSEPSLVVGSGGQLTSAGSLAVYRRFSFQRRADSSGHNAERHRSKYAWTDVTGTGTMSGASGISFTAGSGAVSVTQPTLTGTIQGHRVVRSVSAQQ